MTVELDLEVDEVLFGRTHEARKRHDWQAIPDHYGSQCIRCEEVARRPKHVSTPCQSQPPAYSSDPEACFHLKKRILHKGHRPEDGEGWTHVGIFGLGIMAKEKNGIHVKWHVWCNCDDEDCVSANGHSEEVAVTRFAIEAHKAGLLEVPA